MPSIVIDNSNPDCNYRNSTKIFHLLGDILIMKNYLVTLSTFDYESITWWHFDYEEFFAKRSFTKFNMYTLIWTIIWRTNACIIQN